jgi:signal transduction histidine kinase
LYPSGVDFAASFPAFLAAGLFLVSPHVAIMTLGHNTFGVAGLYVGALPVGAAHILMRTLTLRRVEIERQNQQLQGMNMELARNERLAAIGQMSSAISHQILQKVGVLGLQCDLLKEALRDATMSQSAIIEDASERIGQIDETITDLNATLSDLLIFSRDFVLHVDRCSLDQLLRELTLELQPVAQAYHVMVRYRNENGSGEVVMLLDRIKLKQALLNIMKNAIEASPVLGTVDVTLVRKNDTVHVVVKDYGSGVPAEAIERVFSPFYSTKEKGTGLGLTFAQKIVDLHNGRISVANDPEGGATFVVELPIASTGRGEVT